MKTYLEPEPVQGSFRWLHSHTWIQRWLTAAHRRRACIGMHCPALSACRIQLLFQLSLHPSPSTPLLPPLLPYFPLSVPPSPFPLPPALPHPLASCSIPSLAHLLSAGLCSNHIGASFSNHIILTLAFPPLPPPCPSPLFSPAPVACVNGFPPRSRPPMWTLPAWRPPTTSTARRRWSG